MCVRENCRLTERHTQKSNIPKCHILRHSFRLCEFECVFFLIHSPPIHLLSFSVHSWVCCNCRCCCCLLIHIVLLNLIWWYRVAVFYSRFFCVILSYAYIDGHPPTLFHFFNWYGNEIIYFHQQIFFNAVKLNWLQYLFCLFFLRLQIA